MSGLLSSIGDYIQGLGTFQQMLMTVLISMIPVIELRGAIPIAAAAGLPWYLAALSAIIGNMLPIPIIILFVRKVFEWMKKHIKFLRGIVERLERRAEKKMGSVIKYEILGLAVFVAIPLPGTGAWTGALIAALMNLRLKNAIPPILIGVVVAAVVVTLLSYGIKNVLGGT